MNFFNALSAIFMSNVEMKNVFIAEKCSISFNDFSVFLFVIECINV